MVIEGKCFRVLDPEPDDAINKILSDHRAQISIFESRKGELVVRALNGPAVGLLGDNPSF